MNILFVYECVRWVCVCVVCASETLLVVLFSFLFNVRWIEHISQTNIDENKKHLMADETLNTNEIGNDSATCNHQNVECIWAAFVKWYFHDSVPHLQHRPLHDRYLMPTMHHTTAFQYQPNDSPAPIVVVTISNWVQHSHFQRCANVLSNVLSHLPRLHVNRAMVSHRMYPDALAIRKCELLFITKRKKRILKKTLVYYC